MIDWKSDMTTAIGHVGRHKLAVYMIIPITGNVLKENRCHAMTVAGRILVGNCNNHEDAMLMCEADYKAWIQEEMIKL